MAYKIVDRITRRGTNALLLILNGGYKDNDFDKVNKEYFQKYNKDATVHAVKDSAGICCFKSKKTAEEYVSKKGIAFRDRALIVKVRGFTTVPHPKLVYGCACNPSRIRKQIKTLCEWNDYMPLPTGFISFEKVKVLE